MAGLFDFFGSSNKRSAGKPDEIVKDFVERIKAANDEAWEEGFQRGLRVGARHSSENLTDEEIKQLRESQQ